MRHCAFWEVFDHLGMFWEVFDHPAYSPETAPSDYHLFQHFKRFLGGQNLSSIDAPSLEADFFDTGYRNCPHSMTRASILVVVMVRGRRKSLYLFQ
ncbi:hypothetical protein AVEN_272795-1 [Araneus ventricosus]|uniref:Histone-lysine N-methyltransferase SETMAR n=1 Tax=Araneus ventricosus TaxID=182803 RepID=A0A4Y2RFG8_ARAVE|nr:hypothetical protein AVEN_272795-1 [Araneus ventricosus]